MNYQKKGKYKISSWHNIVIVKKNTTSALKIIGKFTNVGIF